MSLKRTTDETVEISTLFLQYINRPVDVESLEAYVNSGDVQPYDATIGYRIDPRLAWKEGIHAATQVASKGTEVCVNPPSDWGGLVMQNNSSYSRSCATAAYPQQVRDVSTLLQASQLKMLLQPINSRSCSLSVRSWVSHQWNTKVLANRLVAIGVLREAHDFDYAFSLIQELKPQHEGTELHAILNEEAAIEWQRGHWQDAHSLWSQLPDSPIVFFNRGMSALFLGSNSLARASLMKACQELPKESGWVHLASLYLALVDLQS